MTYKTTWTEPLTEVLKVRISTKLFKRLVEAAKADQRKVSDTARILLITALAQREKAK